MIATLSDGDAKALKAIESELKALKEKYAKDVQSIASELTTVYS